MRVQQINFIKEKNATISVKMAQWDLLPYFMTTGEKLIKINELIQENLVINTLQKYKRI